MKSPEIVIAVVGLGYVGLPLALAFGKTAYTTYGFDINAGRVEALMQGMDVSGELSKEELRESSVIYTSDPALLRKTNFIAIAVPTPVNDDNLPDLGPLEKASQLVGKYMQSGTTVVYESTVYPGVTEDFCVPILAEASGLMFGKDFFVGYSPERINPGDKQHGLADVVKIVSGSDPKTAELVATVYSTVCKAGVHRAPSIKVAEAAKIIENTQRDVNIALVNELSAIFRTMGISTQEVLEAAGTKWNFHSYRPGLVGGHCIGVDPYYLVHQSKQLGYEPELIMTARKINDGMDQAVTQAVLQALEKQERPHGESKVLVMGLTFKPNVRDMRNSKIQGTIRSLTKQGVEVHGHDPMLTTEEIAQEFGVTAVEGLSHEYDVIVVAAPHDHFKSLAAEIATHIARGAAVVDITGLYRKHLSNEADYWML